MKNLLCTTFILFFCVAAVYAQNAPEESGATKPVQESERPFAIPTIRAQTKREVTLPAGTSLEIEVAYTVRSVDVRPHDYVSFRVLVPIRIDGVTVIEKDALVTGRILEAKRGGRWGKAGKLSWIMEDVVAVDLSRVPVQASQNPPDGRDRISGISHGGEVAVRTAMLGGTVSSGRSDCRHWRRLQARRRCHSASRHALCSLCPKGQ